MSVARGTRDFSIVGAATCVVGVRGERAIGGASQEAGLHWQPHGIEKNKGVSRIETRARQSRHLGRLFRGGIR